MFRSRPKPGLSRRIVAYYLLFCMIAVGGLVGGSVWTAHAVLREQALDAYRANLCRGTAAVEIHEISHGVDGLNERLTHLAGEFRARYCEVVAVDGKTLAHTDPSQVGRRPGMRSGTATRWGDVLGVEFTDADGVSVTEFRSPLSTGGKRWGELRIGFARPAVLSTVRGLAPMAPIVVLVPMGVIAAGAVLLSRLTAGVGAVDGALRKVAQLPIDDPLPLEPLRAWDATSVGWNRVVEHMQTLQRQAAHGDPLATLEQSAGQRSEAQFEEVLQRLSDGIAVTDAEGRIAFANQAIAALLGADADATELTGAELEQRLLQSAIKPPADEWTSSAARVRTSVCELIQKTGDDERVLRIARQPLSGDAHRGHVWSLRDVTQQKLTEQTRDRFIDTATHELRTPLANIKAYAETLATTDHVNVELQKEFCNIINSEVTRLARFIDDLLSISSMEAGALAITRQKVETERMFAEVLAKIEPLMQQKSIEFEASLPPKMPELSLDKDKIVAVIVNLLGNAAKYTPHGGRVALKVKAEDGELRVSVEDTGYGIAPSEVEKVFDKFFRSDDPRVQAETGTGLGLSLAREIVRMHYGEITVESELNQGSKFVMSLPLT